MPCKNKHFQFSQTDPPFLLKAAILFNILRLVAGALSAGVPAHHTFL